MSECKSVLTFNPSVFYMQIHLIYLFVLKNVVVYLSFTEVFGGLKCMLLLFKKQTSDTTVQSIFLTIFRFKDNDK